MGTVHQAPTAAVRGPRRRANDIELVRGGGRHGVEERCAVSEAIDAIEHQNY